jgi:hypothetical protein
MKSKSKPTVKKAAKEGAAPKDSGKPANLVDEDTEN